jgi:hypothetical protein
MAGYFFCPDDEAASSLNQSIDSPQVCRYLRTSTSCQSVALFITGIHLLHTQRRTALSNQDNAVCNLISKANSDINSGHTSTPSTHAAVKHTSNIARVIGGMADQPCTNLPKASHSDAYNYPHQPPDGNPTVTRVCYSFVIPVYTGQDVYNSNDYC